MILCFDTIGLLYNKVLASTSNVTVLLDPMTTSFPIIIGPATTLPARIFTLSPTIGVLIHFPSSRRSLQLLPPYQTVLTDFFCTQYDSIRMGHPEIRTNILTISFNKIIMFKYMLAKP